MEIAGYQFPEHLFYDENHCWVRQESDVLIMGIDEFGQKMAGDIVYVQLPPEGKKLQQGKTISKIESGKWVGKIISPVDGEIIEANEELEIKPDLINQDCYGEGWIYRIKPTNLKGLEKLVHGREALEVWMENELIKYADNL